MTFDQTAVLRLEGVGKRYEGSAVIGPIELSVGKGEFLTLLGPSGCGKTTTLHIIAGLMKPTEGHLYPRRARDHAARPALSRCRARLPELRALPASHDRRQRRLWPAHAQGRQEPRSPSAFGHARPRGADRCRGRLPHQLSGGQRQRVALARALVIEPSILLLDEPLSNLDALLRKRMRFELRDIQKRLGITTIFVTHDQDEAFEMSDRIVLMNGGHIEQIGTPEDIYDRPRDALRGRVHWRGELARGTRRRGRGRGCRGRGRRLERACARDERRSRARARRPC